MVSFERNCFTTLDYGSLMEEMPLKSIQLASMDMGEIHTGSETENNTYFITAELAPSGIPACSVVI